MKILKIIGLSLLGLLLIITISSFIVSTDMSYEKSVTIDAPIESVWENVNSLSDLSKWSPWEEKDPEMVPVITGTDGTVGAMSTWESEVEEVGKGSQTIVKLEPPTYMESDLKFYSSWGDSEAKGYIKLAPSGNGTTVTWGFASDMPRPFNLMKLMMSMEEMMDAEFSRGLEKLKALSEE